MTRDTTQPAAPLVGEISRSHVHWRTCPDAASFRHPRGHK